MPNTPNHKERIKLHDAKRYIPMNDDAVAIIEKALLPVQHKCQHCTGLFFGEICHCCKMPREQS